MVKNWKDYEAMADLKSKYGASFEDGVWIVRLWHPFAKMVKIMIFDANDSQNLVIVQEGTQISPNWEWRFTKDYDGYFYQFEITQSDATITLALDPYAKSMAPFNWEGQTTNVGKAAFVKMNKINPLFALNKVNDPQPIIYEAHVRDLSVARKDIVHPGTFQGLVEIRFAEHLQDLGITHLQLLPIHSCYALNEIDQSYIGKGQATGWTTNYNWGYDPHNYFSVNGWYSTNPHNPYARIQEFRNLVQYFHKNDIKVIVDVVYNHLFNNQILNNLIPNYYFRDGKKTKPVDQPAFASERAMARRIIIDSLEHWVEYYDVDGFRFDLSTFIDLETINLLTKRLRKIKPNIVLHGEAWNWTDLEPTNSLNKALVDNDFDFAYFNDTTRNAIKGADDDKTFSLGIIAGNVNHFGPYLASIIGNLMEFPHDVPEISKQRYDRFTSYPNVCLNYAACHDGHTLWDKVNLTVEGDLQTKFEFYRQAILMQQLLPGRVLYLQGTELLYTKPTDETGQDSERFHTSELVNDCFHLGLKYHENTYKTSDYTNALRWEHLDKLKIHQEIMKFIADVNHFRLREPFFNYGTSKQIAKHYRFNKVDKANTIIDFTIKDGNKSIRIVHNFGPKDYLYEGGGKILFDSKIKVKNKPGLSLPHSTVVLMEQNE